MKCEDCPCFRYIYHAEDEPDWECIADKEDNMWEDESGCDIMPKIALAIAKQEEEEHMKYLEDFSKFVECLDSEEDEE